MDKKTIYFICTGNSCRSQIAEGWEEKYSAKNGMFTQQLSKRMA